MTPKTATAKDKKYEELRTALIQCAACLDSAISKLENSNGPMNKIFPMTTGDYRRVFRAATEALKGS